MSILLRALALVGAVSHGVNQVAGRLLPAAARRVPGALLLAAALAVGAGLSARATAEAIASQPRPTAMPLGAVLEGGVNEWITVRGLLSGPHVDNSLYASTEVHYLRIRDDPHDREDETMVPSGPRTTIERLGGSDGVPRWFYVLRDPEAPEEAIVVRSARDADAIRDRIVRARLGGTHEGLPLLEEVELVTLEDDERPDTAAALASAGSEVVVGGIFGDPVETDSGTWRYRLTDPVDGTALAYVDAPHAPDALPVELSGLVATDAYHLGLVLETDEMARALDGVGHPDTRLFLDGIGPMLPEPTYTAAIVLGAAAGLLLVSQLVGYPIFRRRDGVAAGGRRPVVGEPIPLTVDGLLPDDARPRVLRGAEASLAWLPPRELERRAWQLRRSIGEPGEAPTLALVAADEAYLLPMGALRSELAVQDGDIVSSTGTRPGLRLSAPGLRATLTFDTPDDRWRARRELDPATPPAPAGDPPPRVAPGPATATPLPRLAASIGLALVALLVLGTAIADVITGTGTPASLVLPGLAAVTLLFLGRGIMAGRTWAREMLPSIALLGIVVAVVIAIGSSICGSWLLPALEACPPFNPIAVAVPAVAAVAFGVGLWATPRLGRELIG